MSENEQLHVDEFITIDDVLNEAISLDEEKERLFAVQLDDGGVVYELEYTTLRNIKSMVANNDYIFIKRTRI